MKNSIACQVHIPNTGHQNDGLLAEEKLKVVELSIELLRHNNPNTYIAFSGHGNLKPKTSILDLCDYIYWDKLSHRLPAQYNYVHKAVKKCKEQGSENILKVRGDGVYMIKNFAEYCYKILESEKKDLLVTQMTANIDKKLGDCIMYSNSKLMDYLWDESHPTHHLDGLIHIGTNFENYYKEQNSWFNLVKKYCSFRNISTLKWLDLRYNYHKLNNIGWDNVRDQLLEGTFPIKDYYWGHPHWHTFDNDNNMIYSIEPFYLEEKTFYEKI